MTSKMEIDLKKNKSSILNKTQRNTKEIAILLLLYTVQGIPIGLSTSIVFLLQGYVSYKDLGLFSLVTLPFSLKIFWAPLVDSFYIERIGRRKTWIIGTLSFLVMFWAGYPSSVDSWLGYANTTQGQGKPNVSNLILYFVVLFVLMSTQDIVVDGWSLTLLSKENRYLSSTCNIVGQMLGVSISNVIFLALNDPKTCNRWIRTSPSSDPIVTLGSFLRICSYVVVFSTILASFFPEYSLKNEKSDTDKEEYPHSEFPYEKKSIASTYKQLFSLLSIAPVRSLSLVLLSGRVAFGTLESVFPLKLVEAGLKKEQLAFLTSLLLPINFLSPIIISRVVHGHNSLSLYLVGWRFRVCIGFLSLCFIWLTRIVYETFVLNTASTILINSLIMLMLALQTICTDLMFSSQVSFFAHVADSNIGGTYMTFLNTVTNIGAKWPSFLALLTLDIFEKLLGAKGYVIQHLIFTFLGHLWYKRATSALYYLEQCPLDKWKTLN
ncbi:acetyl-coenzyme A transporter 1-like isoform X2 [Hylaeus volcanicus]|uniref:acetyl-coenzyme A transporter 1-like isoform X2 n=1 Tax=Hylaeus volcanicus TaxID=313075 RepID=UPI0023B8732E|nr:acetyl-coenzyme A transporter 1-like isoform X2 [Hylaeus volcanicus]